MNKIIAVRLDFISECKARSLNPAYPYNPSIAIPAHLPKTEKIKMLTIYFQSEKSTLIDDLNNKRKSLETVIEMYNALIQAILIYLKDLILPSDEENKKGMFITVTGSLSKNLATPESDVDMDLFTTKETRKKARKLFSEFSSALREVTGHKIEPFFKNIAGFDISHLLYHDVPLSSWVKRLGLIGKLLFSTFKYICDSLYKLIHSSPFKNTIIGSICSKCRAFLASMFSTEDTEFYREYFSVIIPYGFHPHRVTISPNFFWGDNELFLSLFPRKHLVSKDESPLYKFALSRPIPSIILDIYIKMLFEPSFKRTFRLFPLIQLLGYLLGIRTMNYTELINAVRSHPRVVKYLGTDFIGSIEFLDQFKFALSIYRKLRKTHSKKEVLETLANIMGFENSNELTTAVKAHFGHYNEALTRLKNNYRSLIEN